MRDLRNIIRCNPWKAGVTYFFRTSDLSKKPVLAAGTLAARTGTVFLKASLSSVVFIQRWTGGDTSRVSVRAMMLEKRYNLGCFLKVRHDWRPSIESCLRLSSESESHHVRVVQHKPCAMTMTSLILGRRFLPPLS